MNLCFDQLIFMVTQDVFAYARGKATAASLAQGLRRRVEEDNEGIQGRLDVSPMRWATLLQQRTVQIFGRSINIRALISQVLSPF